MDEQNICNNCSHGEVCKNKENMEKFAKELKEKVRLLEYQDFGVHIQCVNYRYYDKTKPEPDFKKVSY